MYYFQKKKKYYFDNFFKSNYKIKKKKLKLFKLKTLNLNNDIYFNSLTILVKIQKTINFKTYFKNPIYKKTNYISLKQNLKHFKEMKKIYTTKSKAVLKKIQEIIDIDITEKNQIKPFKKKTFILEDLMFYEENFYKLIKKEKEKEKNNNDFDYNFDEDDEEELKREREERQKKLLKLIEQEQEEKKEDTIIKLTKIKKENLLINFISDYKRLKTQIKKISYILKTLKNKKKFLFNINYEDFFYKEFSKYVFCTIQKKNLIITTQCTQIMHTSAFNIFENPSKEIDYDIDWSHLIYSKINNKLLFNNNLNENTNEQIKLLETLNTHELVNNQIPSLSIYIFIGLIVFERVIKPLSLKRLGEADKLESLIEFYNSCLQAQQINNKKYWCVKKETLNYYEFFKNNLHIKQTKLFLKNLIDYKEIFYLKKSILFNLIERYKYFVQLTNVDIISNLKNKFIKLPTNYFNYLFNIHKKNMYNITRTQMINTYDFKMNLYYFFSTVFKEKDILKIIPLKEKKKIFKLKKKKILISIKDLISIKEITIFIIKEPKFKYKYKKHYKYEKIYDDLELNPLNNSINSIHHKYYIDKKFNVSKKQRNQTKKVMICKIFKFKTENNV